MPNPKPIMTDVAGAPFRVGDGVVVARCIDGTCDATLLGKMGFVEHFEYDCGCGQTYPSNPMIGVRFASGRLAEFWKEELDVQV